MGIRVGICGVGAFADCFIPLFKHHPDVENVVLCDLDADKLAAKCAKFDVSDCCPSLEGLCSTDMDAIAIITQHHLHGPQAVQALRAGKHVYSAVPSAISLDEITQLVRTVEEAGRIYMIGETSYEEQVGSKMWVTKDRSVCVDLSAKLMCKDIPVGGDGGDMSKVTSADGTHRGVSDVHPVDLLPREFTGLPNGHNGSHQFLVHDFVSACVTARTPPNNVWAAARYLVPGLIAHESALKGGELMEVPDFGAPPRH